MNWLVIRRCIFVSVIVAVLAPFFSMQLSPPIETQPTSGELAKLNKNDLVPLSEIEFKEKVEPYLWENKNHIERLLDAIFYPSFWVLYFYVFLVWFVGLFVSTILVSYLNLKKG